jgi:hypothetical protein
MPTLTTSENGENYEAAFSAHCGTPSTQARIGQASRTCCGPLGRRIYLPIALTGSSRISATTV